MSPATQEWFTNAANSRKMPAARAFLLPRDMLAVMSGIRPPVSDPISERLSMDSDKQPGLPAPDRPTEVGRRFARRSPG